MTHGHELRVEGGDCWKDRVYQAEGDKWRKIRTTVITINKIYLEKKSHKLKLMDYITVKEYKV